MTVEENVTLQLKSIENRAWQTGHAKKGASTAIRTGSTVSHRMQHALPEGLQSVSKGPSKHIRVLAMARSSRPDIASE